MVTDRWSRIGYYSLKKRRTDSEFDNFWKFILVITKMSISQNTAYHVMFRDA